MHFTNYSIDLNVGTVRNPEALMRFMMGNSLPNKPRGGSLSWDDLSFALEVTGLGSSKKQLIMLGRRLASGEDNKEYWGEVDGYKLKKYWRKDQADGEWFAATCVEAGIPLEDARFLRSAIIRYMGLASFNGYEEINDVFSRQFRNRWNWPAIQQLAIDIKEGRAPKPVIHRRQHLLIQRFQQLQSNWRDWPPNFMELLLYVGLSAIVGGLEIITGAAILVWYDYKSYDHLINRDGFNIGALAGTMQASLMGTVFWPCSLALNHRERERILDQSDIRTLARNATVITCLSLLSIILASIVLDLKKDIGRSIVCQFIAPIAALFCVVQLKRILTSNRPFRAFQAGNEDIENVNQGIETAQTASNAIGCVMM